MFSIFSIYSCAQNTHNIEELSSKNSEYHYNIGMAGLTAGNYAVAIANFKKAILKDPYLQSLRQTSPCLRQRR